METKKQKQKRNAKIYEKYTTYSTHQVVLPHIQVNLSLGVLNKSPPINPLLPPPLPLPPLPLLLPHFTLRGRRRTGANRGGNDLTVFVDYYTAGTGGRSVRLREK